VIFFGIEFSKREYVNIGDVTVLSITPHIPKVKAIPEFTKQMAECYMEIFNARGSQEWEESWTLDSATKQVQGYMERDDFCCAVVLDRKRTIKGLCCGVCGPSERLSVSDMPPRVKSIEEKKMALEKLREIGGQQDVLFVVEMGVAPDARRGLLVIRELIDQVLKDALKAGCKRFFFWTSKRSKLYKIVHGIRIKDLFAFSDDLKHVLMTDSVRGLHLKMKLLLFLYYPRRLLVVERPPGIEVRMERERRK